VGTERANTPQSAPEPGILVVMTSHVRVPHRDWLPRVAVGAGVVAAATAFAAAGVPAWEESLFRNIHDLPDAVDPVLWAPMQLGSAVAPVGVAIGAAVLLRSWRPAAGALVAGLGGWWLAKGVKEAVDRGRPYALLEGLERRAGAPTDGLGFLSGHATVAFALAAVLSPYLTGTQRAAAYGLAGTVAFARVHVGAHFPLDVVAGGALGYTLGWLWHVAVGIPVDQMAATSRGGGVAAA
jgi:glycosyltransferase 2 family protein